ncbi:unnamed protein product [Allacma fusca]|uniref:Ankyrin repeat protein n=1 Tax=Allacma fusca TaxID=39272 RepID=A0A8J2PJ33_9HEXA|nr:unnamed protein product [Allacma fusca]
MPPGLLPNFFQAARFRDAAILQACLESGIGVNVQDSYGDTALHYLFAVGCFCNNCVGNLTNCLEILLRHKANPNVENMKGQVPLDLVIENFVPIEFAKLLVDNGARVVYESHQFSSIGLIRFDCRD